jgi:Bacterial capsule synthesis protein PGA_cap
MNRATRSSQSPALRLGALAVTMFAALAGPAAADPPRPLDLAWVGDIAFDGRRGLPEGGPERALHPVRALLRSDLTMGNLEGTLGSGGTTKCRGASNCFAFQAPARYAGALRRSGFGLLDQANNHADDAGPAGIRATGAALRGADVLRAGIGSAVTRTVVNGVRLAVVGFAPYGWSPSLLDSRAAARLVRRADRGADVVVVLIHAGAEGAAKTHVRLGSEFAFGENRGDERRFAHAVVRAGADLVLGSGPHVVRGVERYRDRLIAYSLGNFAGPHTLHSAGRSSLSGVLQLRIDGHGRLLEGRWASVALNAAGLPRPDPAHRAAHLVAELSRQDFGEGRYRIHSDGSFRADERP